jgi:signal transduction histidine kinase/CheY-like chemotaxis protein
MTRRSSAHRPVARDAYDEELRVPPGLLALVMGVSGVPLVVVADIQADLVSRNRWILLAAVLYAGLLASLAVAKWRSSAGKWGLVLTAAAVVHLGNSLVSAAPFLALASVPVALAGLLVGLPAAGAAVLTETVLYLLLPSTAFGGDRLNSTILVLMGVWIAAGVIAAVHVPARSLARTCLSQFEEASLLVGEARQRRAELEATVENLAQANRQLLLANERVAALRAIAEEAQRVKTTFVANVSHEFRTPLNMIIGLSDIMLRSPELYGVRLSPRMREDLGIVHRNCQHLSRMITDVLDLTCAEAGRLSLQKQLVDLTEIIRDAVEEVKPLTTKKGLELCVAIADDLPKVYCDRTRIQQVVLNLVSNAARYTREGKITVSASVSNQCAEVTVADTGPGIPHDQIEAIFEPFSRPRSGSAYEHDGSGLGLSISKQFVTLHGGQMKVHSEVGVGSAFSFTLPLISPTEHAANSAQYLKEDWLWRERGFRIGRLGSIQDLTKPRVIVCDETGTLQSQLVQRSDAAEFVETRGLDEVADQAAVCPAHAVILNAPSPGGLLTQLEEAAKRIRGTPIVGCCVPRPIERALEAGAAGYLVKPVSRRDLQNALRSLDGDVRRVLVVDDDPDVVYLLERMLRTCDASLEVITALDGEEALRVVEHDPPGLILLDVVLPGIDGWETLRRLKADPRSQGIPVFFVSAQDPTEGPAVSRLWALTLDSGIPLSKLLSGTLSASMLLLRP